MPSPKAKLPRTTVLPNALSLSIAGFGITYPEHIIKHVDLEQHAFANFSRTPELLKTLAVSRRTEIDQRPVVCGHSHPLVSCAPALASISQISEHFRTEGVALAARAARKALANAGISEHDVTHVVCTTASDSSNPGYDADLVRALAIEDNEVERCLLAGVGCAGGLAALRTASQIALGVQSCGGDPVILVVATEVVSPFVNMELSRVKNGFVNIAPVLFSDCSSALVLRSYKIEGVSEHGSLAGTEAPESPSKVPIPGPGPVSATNGHPAAWNGPRAAYTIIGFTSWTIPNTSSHLRYDVNAHGWAAVISTQVPIAAASSIRPTFDSLMHAVGLGHLHPSDVDWAVHPGGAAVLSRIGKALEVEATDHMWASWVVYRSCGNSSSATVLAVLHTLRGREQAIGLLGEVTVREDDETRQREYVVAVSFGPGLLVEMTVLRRSNWVACM